MLRLFLHVVVFIALLAGPAMAQHPQNELPDKVIESFENGLVFPVKPAQYGFLQGGRFSNADGNAKGSYYAVVNDGQFASSIVAQQQYALLKGNEATHLSLSLVPTSLQSSFIGQPAAGWVIDVAKYPGCPQLIPSYILEDPSHPKYAKYNKMLKNIPEADREFRTGGGGAIQLYIHDPEERSMVHVIADKIPIRTQHPPTTPGGGGGYNGGNQSRQDFNVQVRSDESHAREIIRDNGRLPGGVLFHSRAHLNQSVRTVRYIADKNLFLINDNYVFKPNLPPHEIAELARLSTRSDRRLAALSQNELLNTPEESTLGKAIAEADNLLGQFAYGFDMTGNYFPKQQLLDSYKNPARSEVKALSWWWFNNAETGLQIQRNFQGEEPRVFLEFGATDFVFNAQKSALEPANSQVDINFQVFTYDENGKEQFLEHPASRFPDIAAATEHLKTNFGLYTARFEAFQHAQQINTTFAFLNYLADHRIACQNWNILLQIPMIRVPFTYDSYNNFSAQSAQAKDAAEALDALEWKWEWLMNDQEQLRYNFFLLTLACQACMPEKIARYRAAVLHCLDKTDSGHRQSRLRAQVANMQACGIQAKLSFAEKYAGKYPALARRQFEQARAYYLRMEQLEPGRYFSPNPS